MQEREHLKRLGCVYQSHPRYFVTTCVHKRRKLLARPDVHEILRRHWAKSQELYGWGDSIDHSKANYDGDPVYAVGDYPYSSPVGSFAPNGYGMYDMTGNTWEWCSDWYDGAYYATSPSSNPRGASTGSFRVKRGGCWFNGARYCRVGVRFGYYPDVALSYFGFRSVLPAN